MGFTGFPPAVSVGSSRLVEQSSPPTTAESGEKGWDSCPDWGGLSVGRTAYSGEGEGGCLRRGAPQCEREHKQPLQRVGSAMARPEAELSSLYQDPGQASSCSMLEDTGMAGVA